MKHSYQRISALPVFIMLVCCLCGILSHARPMHAASPLDNHDYEAENATLGGPASVVNAPDASGGKAVGELWQTGATLTFDKVDGGPVGVCADIVIAYANVGKTSVTTSLSVNGGPATTVSLPSTGGTGSAVFKTVTFPATLKAGTNNTFTFSNAVGAWLCDKITVRPSVSATFSSSAVQGGVITVVACCWPYLLVFLVVMIYYRIMRSQEI